MTDEDLDAWLVWTASLQDALFDELDRMRTGETNATKANAIAREAIQTLRWIKADADLVERSRWRRNEARMKKSQRASKEGPNAPR